MNNINFEGVHGPEQMEWFSVAVDQMKYDVTLEFIAAIPIVWGKTTTLGGKLGEYIVTPRRKGNVWYIGRMTDRDPLPESRPFFPRRKDTYSHPV